MIPGRTVGLGGEETERNWVERLISRGKEKTVDQRVGAFEPEVESSHILHPIDHSISLTQLSPLGGGLATTTNRTYWPITGGAISFQPGWFQGHSLALIYVNMGFGTDAPDGGPLNMSNPMLPVFQVVGPSNSPYPGSVCLPQVPPPKGFTLEEGMNVTIQVVEAAQHGAALFTVCCPRFSAFVLSTYKCDDHLADTKGIVRRCDTRSSGLATS